MVVCTRMGTGAMPPRSVELPRWVHIVGDSVTWGTYKEVLRALAGPSATLAQQYGRSLPARIELIGYRNSRAGPPKWNVHCVKSSHGRGLREARFTRCSSYENWYDHGDDMGFSLPPTPTQVSSLVANATGSYAESPPVVCFSLGSHSEHIGADELAARRYANSFERLVGGTPRDTKLVLALTTALGGGGPPAKFRSFGLCHATNLRVLRRNEAATQAFLDACVAHGRGVPSLCAVLDLFSPTLPWIFEPAVYASQDPVHPNLFRHRPGWAKELLRHALVPEAEC